MPDISTVLTNICIYILYIYILYIYIYVILKKCASGYPRNGFVATHALGHMMYGYILLLPKSAQQAKEGVWYKWS